jgi:hypothetical protein
LRAARSETVRDVCDVARGVVAVGEILDVRGSGGCGDGGQFVILVVALRERDAEKMKDV